MRVVVDTNVIVGALLTPHGPGSVIVGLCLARLLSPLVDDRLLDEYEEVLRRKEFGFDALDVSKFLERLRRVAVATTAAPIPGGTKGLPDQDDAAFLEVAFSGRAEALITLNLRHYPERARNGVVVVTPIEFVQQFLQARKPKSS
jgi:putative PIN family toxin of toxin-antitoxin system